jgi:PEP-CTERM motif
MPQALPIPQLVRRQAEPLLDTFGKMDFIVHNDDIGSASNPTGLRVEVAGTATAQAPEPGSLMLFGAGFAGLCMLRRRLDCLG